MMSMNHCPCCLAEDTCSINGRYENQYEDSLTLCNKKQLPMMGVSFDPHTSQDLGSGSQRRENREEEKLPEKRKASFFRESFLQKKTGSFFFLR